MTFPDVARRALSLVSPRVERRLWDVLREDRLLRWGLFVFYLLGVFPLFLTPFMPLSDMGGTTASATLMIDTAFGHGPASEAYRVSLVPTPYLLTYWSLALLDLVVGPLLAAKLVVATILILVPLGVMRLLVTLRRNPRMALWAFLLSFEKNMFSGWVSFLMGVGICMFVLAWTIEARNAREALKVLPFTAITALAHVQMVLLLLVASPLLVLFGRPLKTRFVVHLIAGSGLLIIMLPYLVARMASTTSSVGSAFSFEMHAPDYKIREFWNYTMDNWVQPSAVRTAAFAFVLLAFGPLCLSLLPRESTRERTFTPLALLAASLGLYAFVWMSISGPMIHWYTYPRYATITLLFLLLVPAPRLDGKWALALLPGLLTVVALDVEVARQFREFGKKTRPMLEVIDHIKMHAPVLPLVFDDDQADPDLKLPPYHQLTSYVAAYKKNRMPSMWDYPGFPIVYRDENRKPWPGWDVGAQRAFTMQAYGPYYDYVIVQGFQRADPLMPLQTGPLPRPRLVLEAGRWRLYEIER